VRMETCLVIDFYIEIRGRVTEVTSLPISYDKSKALLIWTQRINNLL
jgi:hypothetical protein